MQKSNVKILIYDLLDLIDNGSYESFGEIERRFERGNLISYLLDKYNMPNFSKTDTQEIGELLKERIGCVEKNYENGLIYLIDVLLDCE